MVRFIYCCPVLCLLGFLGIRIHGLPPLCQISGPFQFFREAVWDAWRTKVAGDRSSRTGFLGGRYLDFRGSLKLLSSPHLRGGDKGLFAQDFYLGVFGMDFFSALSEEKSFLVVSVVVLIAMDICFGSALVHPLFIFVRVLNFMVSCFVIRVLGLRVSFGMGGHLLSLVLVGFPLGLLQLMMLLVLGWRRFLGSYSEGICREWVPSDQFLDSVASSSVSDHPDVSD